MNFSDIIERMVLDLMVKGVIDHKSLHPLFQKLRSNLSSTPDFNSLLDRLEKMLTTRTEGLEMCAKFQESLRLLEELGNRVKEHRGSGLGARHDIPDRLSYNPKTDAAVVESFQLEITDLFEELEHDLLLLERSLTSEEMINAVMRHLHSIKGLAGFFRISGNSEVSPYSRKCFRGRLRAKKGYKSDM